MKRRVTLEGTKYCSYCSNHIVEQCFDIHILRCRNKQLNAAMINNQEQVNQTKLSSLTVHSKQKVDFPFSSNTNFIQKQNTQLSCSAQNNSKEKETQVEKEKSNLNNSLQNQNPQIKIQATQQIQQISLISQSNQQQYENIRQTYSLPELVFVTQSSESEQQQNVNPHPITLIRERAQVLLSITRFMRDNLFARLQNLIQNFMSDLSSNQQQIEEGMSQQQINQLQKKITTNNNTDETCYICQCEFELEQKLIVLRCHHQFHETCLTPWLKIKSKCPTCKFGLNSSNID